MVQSGSFAVSKAEDTKEGQSALPRSGTRGAGSAGMVSFGDFFWEVMGLKCRNAIMMMPKHVFFRKRPGSNAFSFRVHHWDGVFTRSNAPSYILQSTQTSWKHRNLPQRIMETEQGPGRPFSSTNRESWKLAPRVGRERHIQGPFLAELFQMSFRERLSTRNNHGYVERKPPVCSPPFAYISRNV